MAGLRGDDAMVRLAAVPLFDGLSKRSLRKIVAVAKEQRFGAGDQITTESTRGARFHLIVEGEAVVTKGAREVAVLHPGDTVGEMSLLDDGLRSATVTARVPTTTLSLASWNFRSLLRAEPLIMEKVLLQVVARLREADRSLAVYS